MHITEKKMGEKKEEAEKHITPMHMLSESLKHQLYSMAHRFVTTWMDFKIIEN